MADFLLELLTEEIPARMQAKAAADLAAGFTAACAARGLAVARLEAHATPRRLALLAWGLPEATEATREERRGPRADAPRPAIEGFFRSARVSRVDAERFFRSDGRGTDVVYYRQDAKARFLYAVIDRPGRPAADVLAEACAEAVAALSWPKSMRWGETSRAMDSPRWVRPLTCVVALLGGKVVPLTLFGVVAGRETLGHRFLSEGAIAIDTPTTYAAQLRDAHVILDAAERAAVIAEGARSGAAAAGLVLVEDPGLVAENVGLTEWPVALVGRFDPAFLQVPREVIQLTMRVNQKYFACVDDAGALAPAFVCVANLAALDGGAAIVAGNARVLSARLADARFFWEQDLAIGLDAMAAKLDRVVFHEKLGTMADKAERVGRLARWLAETGAVPGADPALAERAGRLAKADLTSAMVGEFPELQGVMGGHYAAAAGEPAEVAAAVRDHYRPVGPSDVVPVAPVSVAVALADKLDTLGNFILADEAPTGSRDPYALRRAALGIARTIQEGGSRFSLSAALQGAITAWARIAAFENGFVDGSLPSTFDVDVEGGRLAAGVAANVVDFLIDRLKVQQREAGVRHDLIDAVFELGGEDDLVRLLARVHALQAFIASDDGANLLAGYKRAANILGIEAKRDGVERFEVAGHAPTAHDAALAAALEPAAAAARAAVAQEDFAAAMAALAQLRAPIDAFFEGVMVNDPYPDIRAARLGLLQRFRDAVHEVADFSRIEG